MDDDRLPVTSGWYGGAGSEENWLVRGSHSAQAPMLIFSTDHQRAILPELNRNSRGDGKGSCCTDIELRHHLVWRDRTVPKGVLGDPLLDENRPAQFALVVNWIGACATPEEGETCEHREARLEYRIPICR